MHERLMSKGHWRRPEDRRAIEENWDRLFGGKPKNPIRKAVRDALREDNGGKTHKKTG